MTSMPQAIARCWLSLVLVLQASCANTTPSTPDGRDGTGSPICTSTEGDEDSDGIPNGAEGCETGLDTDKDGVPDWKDLDADEDGIADYLEAGEKTAEGTCAAGPGAGGAWPCDSDADGTADFQDTDSDSDGLTDGDEDFNGDGLLGCCLATCGEPRGSQPNCTLNEAGCGPGQSCTDGKCSPAIDFQCSKGETDPRRPDTFGDGTPDKERGTLICREAAPDRPYGRKLVQIRENTAGDWRIALEGSAQYTVLQPAGIPEGAAAALIDEADPARQVAGFVVSRPTSQATVAGAQLQLIGSLLADVPGGTGGIQIRSLGSQGKSHDKFDTILGTAIDLKLHMNSNASRVRNELVATLLGLNPLTLSGLPTEMGDPTMELTIRLAIVRRFGFKADPAQPGGLALDARGYPVDDEDPGKWRLVVIGAVAARSHLGDATRETQIILDDLSNGSTLATYDDGVSDECDLATIPRTPAADIIWVVDDSGSMQDNRDDLVANAKDLFDRAIASGMDFRMAVTGTVPRPAEPEVSLQGKFCSTVSTELGHDGGEDRFLLPAERDIFEGCVANPPGTSMGREAGLESAQAAIERHLPRTDGDPTKIRKDAIVAVILATDELPQEFKDQGLFPDGSGEPLSVPCTLKPDDQSLAESIAGPFLDFFDGQTPGSPETRAIVHFIGGVCGNSCDAQVGHGYLDLASYTGGITVDVCQAQLGSSLQEIINHVIGASSPAVLEHVPISTTLAVAIGPQPVVRSRTKGFDYSPATNSIAFYGVPFPKGARVVTSYRRWMKQSPIQ